jgi:hypothetical protein
MVAGHFRRARSASPLLGWKTKLSILPNVSAPLRLADESVAAFVRAKFSQELLDPRRAFILGIYGRRND